MISGIPNPQIICYYPPPIPHPNLEGRAILLSFLKLLFVLSYSLLRIITWWAVYSQNHHSGRWIRAITEKHGKLQVSHQSLTKLLPRTQTVPRQICQTCPRGLANVVLREKTDCPGNEWKFSSAVIHLRTGALWRISKFAGRCIEDLQIYPRENLQGNIGIRLTQKTKALQNQFGHHCCLSAMDKKLCHKVLKKFQLCKDIEYSCLLFLLDEVIPLSFFHYPVTFRSGNLDDYMATMLKLSILFITWQRRHYDRSMLSMLSDFCFRKHHFPQYHELMKKWLVLTT